MIKLRGCTTCPDKDYCIPDECEDLGAKKMPSRKAMRKGHIEKYPFKVYHIVKPKGNKTMIELKITVDKAVELEQEVKDLYQSIVGAPVKDVEPANWTTNDVKPVNAEPAKKETPKVEEPAKVETPKTEKPKAEEPKVEVPSLEATREAVKDVMAKAADKTKAKGEFKAFLDSIGAEKVTSATDAQRIQIMEWVASRG
ncbi:hypothetical protein [uncultured Veillonella sp.]|uniref:hypothetical protein n=1 Tax=uncultured Veillonella sp. TaxID=159268 RepID=UPI002660471D|nr:hypothetical protein [uncultured Veillonella sp.]